MFQLSIPRYIVANLLFKTAFEATLHPGCPNLVFKLTFDR